MVSLKPVSQKPIEPLVSQPIVSVTQPPKLLIAASGTGGHLFPALATAEALSDCQIEWLGVPDRLETQLVPDCYPLHTVRAEGFQQKLSLKTAASTARTASRLLLSVSATRKLLKQGQFQAVLTTGGYIAAPAVVAARSLGLPVILHESNALPGKVTRWLSPWCTQVALGFEAAAAYLPGARTVVVGTPVRAQFQAEASAANSDLAIPPDVPVILVVGGSQGAVAVNRLVRQAAAAWFEAGAWVVHLTGDSDPEAAQFSHPQYRALPFYANMASLLRRSTLAISRAGAGTLTELAITATPAILIPYPYAAEDHQTYNAKVFEAAGAALRFSQAELTPERLQQQVLNLLDSAQLRQMATAAQQLATPESAKLLAALVRQVILPLSSERQPPVKN